jgi:hypothetical protein
MLCRSEHETNNSNNSRKRFQSQANRKILEKKIASRQAGKPLQAP